MTNIPATVKRWLASDPLILDTETTGLSDDAEIVEIAIIDRSGRTLFESLVRPSGPIPPETIAIHGITDAMVRNKPTWPEVYGQMAAAVGGREVIAYNAPFDRRLVDQVCDRHALPSPAYTAHCAMRAWLVDTGQWDTGVRYARMTKALQHYGVAPKGTAHRAKDDCLTTLGLLEALAGRS